MKEIISEKYGKPFTSDYIFDESVSVCYLRTKSMELSKKLGEHILDSEIIFLKVEKTVFMEAWEIFLRNKMSFTDCTNVSFLKLYGIAHIATFDKEFKKIKGISVVNE